MTLLFFPKLVVSVKNQSIDYLIPLSIIAFFKLCCEEYHYLYMLLIDGLKGFQGQMISSSKVTLYTQSTLALTKISEISQSQDMFNISKPVLPYLSQEVVYPLLPLKTSIFLLLLAMVQGLLISNNTI